MSNEGARFQPRRAIRFIFEYEGEQLRLVAQQTVEMVVAPRRARRASTRPAYYLDARDAGGTHARAGRRARARSAAARKSFPSVMTSRSPAIDVPRQRGAFTVTLPAVDARRSRDRRARRRRRRTRGAGVDSAAAARRRPRELSAGRPMSTADGVVLGTTQIFGTAPGSQAFNVVLLAEGFTDPQQNDFNAGLCDVRHRAHGTEPFGQVAHGLNVFRVNVARTSPAPTIRSRLAAPARLPHTYFDARFGRTVFAACWSATSRSPSRSPCPGSGVLGRAGRRELDDLRRERRIGWRFLARAGGHRNRPSRDGPHGLRAGRRVCLLRRRRRAGSRPSSAARSRRNRTSRSTPTVQTLKWNWAVSTTTALPTMSNPDCASVDDRPSPVPAGTVGLFEGAHYYHCGAYRPEYDCKMRTLSVPFCRVCQHAIATRIAAPSRPSVPIGTIDTPPPSATVAGEVAFTGWAVDDSGIAEVRIYRSPVAGEPTDANGLVFVGTAVDDRRRAAGHRCGVPAVSWRLERRLGIHDSEQHAAERGERDVHAARRGEVSGWRDARSSARASSSPTMPPASCRSGPSIRRVRARSSLDSSRTSGGRSRRSRRRIPFDGSTIDVYIDGVMVGHPSYNHFRPDIAALFQDVAGDRSNRVRTAPGTESR